MLKLFLPILFPSWRFFSSIGPSPRIYYAFLKNENDEPSAWQEFRPRPLKVNIIEGMLRLLHNPCWNEKLYINTCAERLFEGYSLMREQEIMRRVLRAIALNEIAVEPEMNYVVYRITAIIREDQILTQEVTFVAKPVLVQGIA